MPEGAESSASLYFLINFVVVERASTAHNKENRDHVPEAKRSHLASTREKPSVSNNRDRSNTAEECAWCNPCTVWPLGDRDMLDGIVTPHPSNEIVHPVVGQRRGERYPGFHQLRVNSIVNIHVNPIRLGVGPGYSIKSSSLEVRIQFAWSPIEFKGGSLVRSPRSRKPLPS